MVKTFFYFCIFHIFLFQYSLYAESYHFSPDYMQTKPGTPSQVITQSNIASIQKLPLSKQNRKNIALKNYLIYKDGQYKIISSKNIASLPVQLEKPQIIKTPFYKMTANCLFLGEKYLLDKITTKKELTTIQNCQKLFKNPQKAKVGMFIKLNEDTSQSTPFEIVSLAKNLNTHLFKLKDNQFVKN